MRTYYIQPYGDGTFSVQVVEDGLDDFSSSHATREEAQAAMAAEIVRDAAPDLLAALSMGVTMRAAQRAYFKDRTQKNLITSKEWEAAFDKAAHDAVAKATGALTQGGLAL